MNDTTIISRVPTSPVAGSLKVNLSTCVRGASSDDEGQDACAAELWHDALIAVVADGVGRAEHAREAATRAVDSLVTNFKARPSTWGMPKALEEFTRLINRTLYQESMARFERPEMLSTLAVATIEGDRLVGLNVGDSRVYHYREGNLTQLSIDHAESDPNLRHVLNRAAGMASDVSPHCFEHPVLAGDRLFLCSDGVSNVLSEEELQDLLRRRVSARTIVATAREKATAENLDDMSAVVAEIVQIGPGGRQSLEIPESLRAGQVMEGYTLVRPFNTNERTWIAQREGRQIVMKFAPLQARDSESVRHQFAKEIWSLTRFRADYFIHAYVPENSRVFCYCMDYVEAPTLKDVLRAGALTVDETVGLARFLVDACQFLLGFDLVHGDLKPENILVLKRGEEPRFKLIDFGSITEVFSITNRAGTPSYLAPERFQGAPISERTEVFALGIILHESLTGSLPYGDIEPFQTPVFREPRKPTTINPNLPPWLDAVLLRAIAARPEERYQNYSELKFDVLNPTRVKPWFRRDTALLERNPALFFKIAFAVSVLLNLILLLLLSRR